MESPAMIGTDATAQGRRVMIVDDDEMCLGALHQIITRWGHDVVCFHSFSEARAYLATETPEVAIVDVRLGGQIDHFFWSLAVQNLFDVQYFDYAIASAFALNTYSAYPQPGRTFLARAGVAF